MWGSKDPNAGGCLAILLFYFTSAVAYIYVLVAILMPLRNLLRIVFGLLILFAVVIGLTSINHPIILKWVTGSASHHGKPIPVIVYTNGQVNDNVKVFYTDKANNYLIHFTGLDSSGVKNFFNINLEEKWIGRPVGNGINDYDYIAGHLFQSETGAQFSPFEDDMKGFDFEPQLSFTGTQIKFYVPASRFNFDSVRIELK